MKSLPVSFKYMKQTLLEIEETEDHTVLIVKDYEVFDYLEDVLTEEHELEFSFMSEKDADGSMIYKMFFSKSTSNSKLRSTVNAIDAAKLKKIWKLNN